MVAEKRNKTNPKSVKEIIKIIQKLMNCRLKE
jgi:hypothetical protein